MSRARQSRRIAQQFVTPTVHPLASLFDAIYNAPRSETDAEWAQMRSSLVAYEPRRRHVQMHERSYIWEYRLGGGRFVLDGPDGLRTYASRAYCDKRGIMFFN
jgi:hypothetical protein